MKSQHFRMAGGKDNEEIYQIFGPCLDSKDNRHASSATASNHLKPEDQTVSSFEIVPNSTSNGDNENKCIEEDEARFCYLVLNFKGNGEKSNIEKVTKEIKVDYFQLARLSKKFQRMKQFYYFPFIKRFKFDIKYINEDTFLEFIKSTQGEEFTIKETNYFELYHLSNEWETQELTSILEDYGKRHESDMCIIIQQYINLTKEYDHQKEENIEKLDFRRGRKDNKIDEDSSNNFNNNKREKCLKNQNKTNQIKIIEEKMRNRIEECLKTKNFWDIRIETIERLINESSKHHYSHDLLLECIMESIEKRGKLIELIDPCLITEDNHKKLVDQQFNILKGLNNAKPNISQYTYINIDLIIDSLQKFQESNKNFNFEENIKLNIELKKKESAIEERDKELIILKEREIILCNEFKKIKESIWKDRKEVKKREREVKISEIEAERSLKEVNSKEFENHIREEENARREEENARREEENARREEENARREEENVQREEENVQREEENVRRDEENARREEENVRREEENKRNEEENKRNEEENKRNEEKTDKRWKEIEIKEKEIERRKKEMEENKNCFEKEKKYYEKNKKDEEEKCKENEKQQKILIDELRSLLKPDEATATELENFLKENKLATVDGSAGSYEAIHIACQKGNKKIVSYILSKNPSKLNVRNVFNLANVDLFNILMVMVFNKLINCFSLYN